MMDLICLGRGSSLRSRAVCAAVAALSISGFTASAASAAPVPYSPTDGSSFFARDSFWNTPLSGRAKVAKNSKTLVSTLVQATRDYTPWINTTKYSVPVYNVPADQPKVGVVLDTYKPALQADFAQVPIPPNALASVGTDGHLVINQPSTDTMWEFWRAYLGADGKWHARWGGKMSNVSSNPGYFDNPYGATATSLPLVGGLLTIEDQRQGVVDHAVAFAMPGPRDTYVWPAQRGDGDSSSTSAIPEGTRFRLPADLDVDAMNLSPEATMITKAIQKYGLVLRDKAGSVVLYGEDPGLFISGTVSAWNPYWAFFGTQTPDAIMKQLPWGKMQAIDPSVR